MANTTDSFANAVHGTNPQYLIEKITRLKIYNTVYWKEECFGLTAATIIDKAVELKYFGGNYGGNLVPTKFLCLLLKMLQLQPEKEIVYEFIQNEDFPYLRVLSAFYLRLTGKAEEIYTHLEPLYNDYRTIVMRNAQGFTKTYMDEFIDSLLREEQVCEITLPHMIKRMKLEELNVLQPRKSLLEDEFDEDSDEESEEEEDRSEDEEKNDVGLVEDQKQTKNASDSAVLEAEQTQKNTTSGSAVAFEEEGEEKEDSNVIPNSEKQSSVALDKKEVLPSTKHEDQVSEKRGRSKSPVDRKRDRRDDSRDRRRSSRDGRRDHRDRSRSRSGDRRYHSDKRRSRSRSRDNRRRRDSRDSRDRHRDRRRRDRSRSPSYSDRSDSDDRRKRKRRDDRKEDDREKGKERSTRHEEKPVAEEHRGRGREDVKNKDDDFIMEVKDVSGTNAGQKLNEKQKKNEKLFDKMFKKKSDGAGAGKNSASGGSNAKVVGKEIIGANGQKYFITAPEGTVEYWNQIRESLGMKKLK